MVISPREKMLFYITLLAMVLIIGDKFVLSSTIQKWKKANNNIAQIENERHRAQNLFEREPALMKEWARIGENIPQSESRDTIPNFLDHLKKLAESNGISLTDIYPVPTKSESEFSRAVFELKFRCNIAQLNKLMYALTTSPKCLYVSRIGISSRTDRAKKTTLDVDMRISTLIAGEM